MLKKFLSLLSGLALLSGVGAVFSAPSYANYPAIQFSCDTSGHLPKTVAINTATGQGLTVIKWYSEYFSGSGYDSLTRCNEVSARFQRAYGTGELNYITAGIVNGYSVICATTPGGGCNGRNVLFTLKRGANAAATLQRLFDVRESAGPALYEASGRTYINLQQKLAPINGEAAPVAPNTPVAPNAPAAPNGRAF
jgi:hypothetical protein